jgi:hypothetical protein
MKYVYIGVIILGVCLLLHGLTQRTHDKYQKIIVEHQLNKK